MKPIHMFTMSIADIHFAESLVGVPIRYMREGKKRGPMIFLPGGDEFHNWLLMNIVGETDAPVNSRIEFHVGAEAKASCHALPRIAHGVRCDLNRMDGRYPYLLWMIGSLSENPRATWGKLLNAQYYGKFPPGAK
ncbi:MAG: hypothetical protein V1798_05990 [Pseudomonadota bacterium]